MEGFKLPNYLKMHRMRSGLTQAELGRLLGCDNSRRYERRQRSPGLKIMIGYELIFGVNLDQLFEGTYEDIREATQQRARALIRDLAGKADDPENVAKISFLKELLARISTTSGNLHMK